MAFNSVNLQFKTLADFAAYLGQLPPPGWNPVGSTYHNTYIPNLAQWRGLASMQSMQATYVSKGWTAGPHLFLAFGAPNRAHDGIFVMTPPTSAGIHSPSCNGPPFGPPPGRFGVELVGDYQSQAPTAPQQQLLIDAIAALHQWAKLGANLNAHRDCDPRTCPGDAFYALKPNLQRRLQSVLSADPWPLRWGPIAPPDQTSWGWDIPQTWKLHWQRLGKCISSALYDHPNELVIQCFEGGDVRQRAGKPTEVTFK
jgi:hypothetical protein